MDVLLDAGAWVDVSTMLRTIKKAGYPPVPEDVRLTVSGTIRRQGDEYVIELDAMKKSVALALILGKDNARIAADLAARGDRMATLEGHWQPPADGQAGTGSLRVDKLL